MLELSYVGCMLSCRFGVAIGTSNAQIWGGGAREHKRVKKKSLQKMINKHTKCVERKENKLRQSCKKVSF